MGVFITNCVMRGDEIATFQTYWIRILVFFFCPVFPDVQHVIDFYYGQRVADPRSVLRLYHLLNVAI